MCVVKRGRKDYSSILDTERGLLGGLRRQGKNFKSLRVLGLLRVPGWMLNEAWSLEWTEITRYLGKNFRKSLRMGKV